MTKYYNIHKQQLFHWTGSDIEKLDHNKDYHESYVKRLEETLKNGLWLRVPEIPDQLNNKSMIKVQRPIVCFTEWSLNDSISHTKKYGKLGFGFSKRFILQSGGQPVSYVKGQKNDPYTKSLEELAKFFNDKKNYDSSDVDFEKAKKDFEYIAHFAKRIKFTSDVRPAAKKNKITVKTRIKREVDPFKRRFGQILQYLEEREWRIVYDNYLAKKINLSQKSKTGKESYYLPFVSGSDLFTVVLPDNRTVKLAQQVESIRKILFPEDRPHVTILSLEDIGTF